MSVAPLGTILLTATVGLSLGMLGSGGSIVMLPVLVYVAGVAPAEAVPLSLAVVGATSAVGAILYLRNRAVQQRPMWLFAASGVPGSWLGSAGTRVVAPHALMLIFSSLMLIVGALMLRRGVTDAARDGSCDPPRCLLAGAAVGALTGFLGVGGGFLLVPALIWFAGLETRAAVGTSLAIIAMNAAGGLTGHIGNAAFPWVQAGTLSAVAVLGMVGGLRVSLRMDSRALRVAFAWFVLAIAVGVAATNLPALLRG